MAYIVTNPYVKKSMLLCYIRHYIACVADQIRYNIQPLFKKGAHDLPDIIKTCSIAL